MISYVVGQHRLNVKVPRHEVAQLAVGLRGSTEAVGLRGSTEAVGLRGSTEAVGLRGSTEAVGLHTRRPQLRHPADGMEWVGGCMDPCMGMERQTAGLQLNPNPNPKTDGGPAARARSCPSPRCASSSAGVPRVGVIRLVIYRSVRDGRWPSSALVMALRVQDGQYASGKSRG